VEHDKEAREYLTRLAKVLAKREFATRPGGGQKHPYLKVMNPDAPELNERVLCDQAEDGSWCYWWPWRQPIGSVDDLEAVTNKIASVLRSVEGES
jgi:hypothetical protein